jgi:hypothetical protein
VARSPADDAALQRHVARASRQTGWNAVKTDEHQIRRNQSSGGVDVRNDDQADKEQEGDQEVDRDETDTHNETIFGRRRPDSIAVEWISKVLYVLEFKRTSDQRRNYRERGEARARAQHDVLVKSLERWEEKQLERIANGKSN